MQVSRPDIFKEHKRNPKKLWIDKNENIDPRVLNFVKKKIKLTKKILCAHPNLSSTYKKIVKVSYDGLPSKYSNHKLLLEIIVYTDN